MENQHLFSLSRKEPNPEIIGFFIAAMHDKRAKIIKENNFILKIVLS